MAQAQITKEEFVRRATELTVELFSTMPPDEQERRLSAAERRVAKIKASKKGSYSDRTPQNPLVSQSPR